MSDAAMRISKNILISDYDTLIRCALANVKKVKCKLLAYF